MIETTTSPGSGGDAPEGGVRETRYPLRNPDGEVVAIHVRVDKPGGGKDVKWKSTSGAWGLNGTRLEDLPLYGVHELGEPMLVVLVEGEPARDALDKALREAEVTREQVGVLATVTGASSTPSPEVLEVLRGHEVVLWPDRDDPGRIHMQRVAERLVGVSLKTGLFDWPEAPEKGDAADHAAVQGGGEQAIGVLLNDLLGAVAWKPPEPSGHGKADVNGHRPATAREWPKLNDAALQGLAGKIVRAIEPHTEADPVAVLVNLLTAFGSAAGRGAHVVIGADQHHLNLYTALVGKTAKGRKGTSWGPIRDLLHAADAAWVKEQVLGGLSSGEGLINAVRDPVETEGKDGKRTVVDAGAPDKRLLVVESEFAAVLKVMTREGNILSTIVRQAWDGGKLATLTRHSPLKATNAHISIIAHVTKDELLKRLSEADTAGGFTNRFLWLCVERSKKLPRGGKWNEVNVAPLVSQLTSALEFARGVGPITWGVQGGEMWDVVYDDLSEGEAGMVGAATSRAEAQTLRLAALYAVMDESHTIEREHLEAALALWEYAESSARFIFGTATGDPVVDRIMEAMREKPKGLTRTQINNELFGGHQKSERISSALGQLEAAGLIRKEEDRSKPGRPVEKWLPA